VSAAGADGAGPVSDQALEGIIFRAAHPVVHSLWPYPAAQRAALLPSVVRLLLASFLELSMSRESDGPPMLSSPLSTREVDA
jgi:hypothetical protein